MGEAIRSVVVVGGGSAGFLAALTFRRMLPQLDLTVVHSPDIPVIGVGESTTPAVPVHLHETLGIDRFEFHREVQPSWKLGLRFEWGAADVPYFNYTFDRYLDTRVRGLNKWLGYYCLADSRDCSIFNALMDRNKSPAQAKGQKFSVDPRATYHLPNERFIAYLQRKSRDAGATLLADEVVGVIRNDAGDIERLRLKSGRDVAGDLFIDCSGFASLLLGKTLEEPYISYNDALFCDSAAIGSWQRDDEVRPYTTMTTMDHGWAWRIDFPDVVTRGYVFSSAFCADENAARELQEKNPELGNDVRVIKFPTGRYERHWVRNVAAVGNASGFVEPLEATSLHLIIEQLYNLAWGLIDCDAHPSPELRELLNQRFQRTWDDVRDFLALHYKYNAKRDTPFWRQCREETPLGAAQDLVDHYTQLGPSRLIGSMITSGSIFGFGGYMSMLLGLRVPTRAIPALSVQEAKAWRAYQDDNRRSAEQALPMRTALERASAGNRAVAPIDVPKVGRNQACPCGSKKKYKFCHGATR
jgi:tryptophan halogenase